MQKMYDSKYVAGLENRLKEAEAELRGWKTHGVMLPPDVLCALYYRERERELEDMTEAERRAQERVDEALLNLGL